MFVLHAGWLPEKREGAFPWLFLWAEIFERHSAKLPPQITTHKSLTNHPFTASAKQLDTLLAANCQPEPGRWQNFNGMPAKAVIYLPTAAGLPILSPQLQAAIARQKFTNINTTCQADKLQPWILPGLALLPTEIINYLPGLLAWLAAGKLPANIILADSLLFLLQTTKLLRQLIHNEQYLPSIKRYEYQGKLCYRACWQLKKSTQKNVLPELILAMPTAFCHLTEYNPGNTYLYHPPDKQHTATSLLAYLTDSWLKNLLHDYQPAAEENFPPQHLSAIWSSWLEQLTYTTNNSYLPGSPKQLENLFQSLQTWQQIPTFTIIDQHNFHTCFRLEEPTADPCAAKLQNTETGSETTTPDWHLNFLIQPADDASLLLPAKIIWEAATDTFHYLDRQFPNLQDKLLQDLTGAAEIFPPLFNALKEAFPAGLNLTINEAYHFLSVGSKELQQAGYVIIIPNWWQQGRQRLKVTLQIDEDPDLLQSFVGINALCSYNLRLSIGDQTLTQAELEDMVALKTPLVHTAGHWLEISPTQTEAAIKMLHASINNNNRLTFAELLRYNQETEEDWCDYDEEELPDSQKAPAFAPQITIAATDKLQTILQQLSGEKFLPALPTPPDFKGVLRPYQKRGFSWLTFLHNIKLGGCLADDMGLGKTIQVLACLLQLRQESNKLLTTLIICPTSVLCNWQREINKFAPAFKTFLHSGPRRPSSLSAFQKQARHADIVLTSYTLASRDEYLLTSLTWQTIVLDEAQNIKNHAAKQTLSIYKLQAQFRLALTGTPVENRLSELWSILHFCNPGYLGTLDEFRQLYALPIEKDGNIRQQKKLQQIIKPFVLRRLKTDRSIINDLPEKQETKIYCTLSKEQATLYAAVLDVMIPKLETASSFARRALLAATLTKLKQVCNHPVHFLKDGSKLSNRSGKLTRLLEMADEVVAEGRHALIFTQYKQMGDLLVRQIQEQFGCQVYFLHGRLSQTERDHLVTSFRDEPEAPPFFVLSLKAGGVGLNLTRADTVFHFDRWWNPAVENQATDRAFRIGQTQNVQVYKFICTGTLEEKIDKMIESKKTLAENIIGSGESWLNELSTTELKKVLSLRRTAMEGSEIAHES